ncbi:MAG: DUF502 domain-containing protein [Fibrobacterota bacterium]
MNKFVKKALAYFLQGLLALLPLIITLFLAWKLLGFLTGIISGFLVFVPAEYRDLPFVAAATKLAAAILLFFHIALFGLLIKTLVGKLLVAKIDKFLSSIPGVSVIYRSSRQVIDLLSMERNEASMRPVLVEFPCHGSWSIAFKTGEASPALCPEPGKKYFTVFVPTTPNPTSGYLLILTEEQMKPLTISVEQAIKLILTGGMVKE